MVDFFGKFGRAGLQVCGDGTMSSAEYQYYIMPLASQVLYETGKICFFPHLTSLEVRFHLHCVIIQSREQSDSCLQLANKREHKDTACYLIYIPESHNLGAHIHTHQTKKKKNSLLDIIPYASLPMTKRFSTHTPSFSLFKPLSALHPNLMSNAMMSLSICDLSSVTMWCFVH